MLCTPGRHASFRHDQHEAAQDGQHSMTTTGSEAQTCFLTTGIIYSRRKTGNIEVTNTRQLIARVVSTLLKTIRRTYTKHIIQFNCKLCPFGRWLSSGLLGNNRLCQGKFLKITKCSCLSFEVKNFRLQSFNLVVRFFNLSIEGK